MVDIRPNVLPDAILPLRTGDALIVDQGTDGVRQVNPFDMTDSVAPIASQAEAVAGTDNTKRMTPLRTKQSVASEVGVTLASNSQGVKADSAVQSVNGKTGNYVSLVKADVGLSNVDNTSDVNKPISTATQAALDSKANSSVTISAGTGLTGGGTLEANRSILLNSASIASLAKADSSVQTVNGVAPVSGNVDVAAVESRLKDSREDAELGSYASNVNFIITAGYYAAGDGGAALYKKVISDPGHAGAFQSADGKWWDLSGQYITPNMFGAKCDGTFDDGPAINMAWDYATGLSTRGYALNLVSTKTYHVGTSIQLGPVGDRQRVLEGNGTLIKVLPAFTGYMFDSNNLSGVFAWRVELRNFTADGIYMSANVNFMRLRHVNGLNLDHVYIQSFNIGLNLDSSYAVATRGVTFRYIRQHAFFINTSSMQLKLIDTRCYGMNSGDGVPAAAAIRNNAINNNIILIGCDFEGGKGSFFYTNFAINQISITDSYIEGYEQIPVYFDAAVSAFVFEGNWLGYNNGRQDWMNIKSGRISGNVFASQPFSVGAGNGDVFEGNNSYINQGAITPASEQTFYFRIINATMASGATALDFPGYKRTPDGVTFLSGRLSRTANGDLFTLPVGYRPRVAAVFLTVVEGTFNRARIDITTAGVVSVVYESTAGALRLDGLSFLS